MRGPSGDYEGPNFGGVAYDLHCSVPGCDRWWYTKGGRKTGFQIASGNSHAYAHWRRWHAEHGHAAEDPWVCERCWRDCWAAAPRAYARVPRYYSVLGVRQKRQIPPFWGR